MAAGGAGGATAENASDQLECCTETLGTLAVEENRGDPWYSVFRQRFQLESTVPTLRLLIQQSNCFVLVECGRTMNNMMTERQLEQSGEMRSGSNFGKGQMVAADYTLIPPVTFSKQDTGGLRGVVGALSPLAGAMAGSFQFNDAATVLTMIDNRSGVQLAAAEGSARNMDFGGVGALFAGVGLGLAGAPRRRRRRCSWLPSWIPTTRWCARCATTRHRPCAAAWAPAGASVWTAAPHRRPGKSTASDPVIHIF